MKTYSMAVLALVAITVVGCGEGVDSQAQMGTAGAAGGATGAAGSGGTTGAAGAATQSGPAGTTGAGATSGTAGTTGEGGAAGTSAVDRFVGSWRYTSGTITRICAGATETFTLAGDEDELARSIDGGLTQKGGSCAAKLMVSGTTATAAPSFSCTQVDAAGGSTTVVYSSLVYSTLDGVNMSLSSSGTVTFLSGGSSTVCTFSATGTAMKYAL